MWKILTIIAAISMLLSFFRRKNAIWGGATIGLVIGIITAIVKNFNWSITYKAVVIGILVGLVADLLGMIADLLKKKSEKEPTSLLEAITRISTFSYEPLVSKYPYFKDYLEKHEAPKAELTLWMTAAGAGYALATKEAYVGEHDEIIKSIVKIEGLNNLVEDIAKKFHNFKDNEEERALVLPFWVISHLKNEKPTKEDINGPGIDIAKLLDLCIRDYEVKQSKIKQ